MALAVLEAHAVPRLRYGDLQLRLPLTVGHDQTLPSDFDETSGRGTLQLSWRVPRLWGAELHAGLAAARRVGWPDPYKAPLADGSLDTTPRRSYWSRSAGGELWGRMGRLRATLSYEGRIDDYDNDPDFEAYVAPMHLTPSDRSTQELKLAARYKRKRWQLEADVAAFEKEWFYLFARDAGTGKTHSGAGGAPPNPLQVHQGVAAGLEASWKPSKDTQIGARYDYIRTDDVFQGYYSKTAHRPGVEGELELGALNVELGASVEFATYGPDSYAEGPSHAPLTSGTRRWDRRTRIGGEARYALTGEWSLFLAGSSLLRSTNYPATIMDGVDYNYTNWRAVFGIELERR